MRQRNSIYRIKQRSSKKSVRDGRITIEIRILYPLYILESKTARYLPLSYLCHWTTDLGHCSYDLPDDVFLPGETKPTRPKKKSNKKRDLDAMEVRVLLPSSVDTCPDKERRLPSVSVANPRLTW